MKNACSLFSSACILDHMLCDLMRHWHTEEIKRMVIFITRNKMKVVGTKTLTKCDSVRSYWTHFNFNTSANHPTHLVGINTWYFIGAWFTGSMGYELSSGGEYTPIQSASLGLLTPDHFTVTQFPDCSIYWGVTLSLIYPSAKPTHTYPSQFTIKIHNLIQ